MSRELEAGDPLRQRIKDWYNQCEEKNKWYHAINKRIGEAANQEHADWTTVNRLTKILREGWYPGKPIPEECR